MLDIKGINDILEDLKPLNNHYTNLKNVGDKADPEYSGISSQFLKKSKSPGELRCWLRPASQVSSPKVVCTESAQQTCDTGTCLMVGASTLRPCDSNLVR